MKWFLHGGMKVKLLNRDNNRNTQESQTPEEEGRLSNW